MSPTTPGVPSLAQLDAVLLDMDGTLVDSTPVVERQWTLWAGEHGIDPAAVLAECHGRTAEATIRRHLPDITEAEVTRQAAERLVQEAADTDGLAPIDDAAELLALLDARGVPWAVVTNSNGPLARVRLGACDIEPPVLVTVDDVAAGKPDPEGYVLAARRCGADVTRCLVVEDSPSGLQAGRAAGARVVEVGHGTTLADLMTLLDR